MDVQVRDLQTIIIKKTLKFTQQCVFLFLVVTLSCYFQIYSSIMLRDRKISVDPLTEKIRTILNNAITQANSRLKARLHSSKPETCESVSRACHRFGACRVRTPE